MNDPRHPGRMRPRRQVLTVLAPIAVTALFCAGCGTSSPTVGLLQRHTLSTADVPSGWKAVATNTNSGKLVDTPCLAARLAREWTDTHDPELRRGLGIAKRCRGPGRGAKHRRDLATSRPSTGAVAPRRSGSPAATSPRASAPCRSPRSGAPAPRHTRGRSRNPESRSDSTSCCSPPAATAASSSTSIWDHLRSQR